MQNNQFYHYEDLITTIDGVETSRTPGLVFHSDFSCTNGLKQGDHIHPNANNFYSRKVYGHQVIIHNEDHVGSQKTTSITSGVDYVGPSIIPSALADYARTQDRALEKCFDQLRGESANLIVDLAESAAAIKMLKNVLRVKSLFGDFVRSVVKTQRYQKITNGQKRLDYVTGKWLEYRYGWMPLVYSTYDVVNNLSKDVTRGIINVKGRSGGEIVAYAEYGDGSHVSPAALVTHRNEYRTEYGLQFYLKPGLQIYDWTSLNPLAIAWELTPLSFVADWFVNVGQQLSLMENYWLFNSAFRSGYKTNSGRDTLIVSREGHTFETTFEGLNLHSFKSDGGTQITTTKDRVVLSALPFPSMNLRVSCKLGANRLLDAASLFQQLIGRKSRGFRQT